ncbi:MAG: hypothetical protein J5790_08365 [Bacteroidaceae bacterium]|nr:hypothetical protein [Bacteroidaceae bacterium]
MENKCIECGNPIEEGMLSCPHCGASLGKFEESWYQTNLINIAINPVVSGFDSGRFFRNIIIDFFYCFAFIFIIIPTCFSVFVYSTKMLAETTASFRALVICSTIIVLLFGIFSCGYWVKRIEKLNKMFNPNDEFVVMPIGSYCIQWIGEWLAILLGIAGIMSIFLSFIEVDSIPFFSSFFLFGWAYGLLAMIVAIIIVFVTRFYAESKRALTSIANNTGRLSIHETINLVEKEDGRNGALWNIVYAVSILITITCLIISIFQ